MNIFELQKLIRDNNITTKEQLKTFGEAYIAARKIEIKAREEAKENRK